MRRSIATLCMSGTLRDKLEAAAAARFATLPPGHPLWTVPGLLLTPHVAGAVPETNARAAAAVTEQLARILAGEELQNVVDRY